MEELIPQSLENEVSDSTYQSDISPSFTKQVLLFMGVEFLVALFAVSYLFHLGPFTKPNIATAPIESYDPSLSSTDQSPSADNHQVLGAETTDSTSNVVVKVIPPLS